MPTPSVTDEPISVPSGQVSLSFDQIAYLINKPSPEVFYRRAAAFDGAYERLQEVRDQLRNGHRSLLEGWLGMSAERADEVLHKLVGGVAEHLQAMGNPAYGDLMRKAGDALSDGQRRMKALQDARAAQVAGSSDPAVAAAKEQHFLEQAKRILTELRTTFHDIGLAFSPLPDAADQGVSSVSSAQSPEGAGVQQGVVALAGHGGDTFGGAPAGGGGAAGSAVGLGAPPAGPAYGAPAGLSQGHGTLTGYSHAQGAPVHYYLAPGPSQNPSGQVLAPHGGAVLGRFHQSNPTPTPEIQNMSVPTGGTSGAGNAAFVGYAGTSVPGVLGKGSLQRPGGDTGVHLAAFTADGAAFQQDDAVSGVPLGKERQESGSHVAYLPDGPGEREPVPDSSLTAAAPPESPVLSSLGQAPSHGTVQQAPTGPQAVPTGQQAAATAQQAVPTASAGPSQTAAAPVPSGRPAVEQLPVSGSQLGVAPVHGEAGLATGGTSTASLTGTSAPLSNRVPTVPGPGAGHGVAGGHGMMPMMLGAGMGMQQQGTQRPRHGEFHLDGASDVWGVDGGLTAAVGKPARPLPEEAVPPDDAQRYLGDLAGLLNEGGRDD